MTQETLWNFSNYMTVTRLEYYRKIVFVSRNLFQTQHKLSPGTFTAIQDIWMNFTVDYIQSLYNSIPSRILQLYVQRVTWLDTSFYYVYFNCSTQIRLRPPSCFREYLWDGAVHIHIFRMTFSLFNNNSVVDVL